MYILVTSDCGFLLFQYKRFKNCKHSIILSDDLIQLYKKCLDIYDSYQELMHKYESVDSDDIDIDEKFFDIKSDQVVKSG